MNEPMPAAGVSATACQLLARYNRWMNERMFAALAALGDAERKRDRGAFFGSIHRTLNHILWADGAWLARFEGAPYGLPAFGADLTDDFADLHRRREAMDRRILDWAGQLEDAWLQGTLVYRAASDGQQRRLPAWIGALHLFNHATHHRGQVTALMAQAGADMGVTDLPWLPGVVRMA